MTQKQKIEALEAQIAEAESAAKDELESQLDPKLEEKAKTLATYAIRDVNLVIEALGFELSKEQISVARKAILDNKREYVGKISNKDPESLDASF